MELEKGGMEFVNFWLHMKSCGALNDAGWKRWFLADLHVISLVIQLHASL